jgi:hypothetical protein
MITPHRAGIIGLLGALLMFTGDMLLYGLFGSGAEFLNVYKKVTAAASLSRLIVAGIIGPVAAFLYLFGLWHVYRNLEQSGRILAKIILGALTLAIIVGGAYHAFWPAYSLVLKAKAAATAGAIDGLEILDNHLREYMEKLYLVAEVPGFFGAALLFYAVLFRKTNYPRWMVLLNPGLLMLLEPLAEKIPAPIGAVIVGGYFNLTFVIFFAASLLVTRERRSEST